MTALTTPTAPTTPATPTTRPTDVISGDVISGDVISGARRRIDELDGQIIALVQERMGVSAEIQRTRIESGGRRVHLSREMEVLGHWSDALGRSGTALAMTLLELCRGRV